MHRILASFVVAFVATRLAFAEASQVNRGRVSFNYNEHNQTSIQTFRHDEKVNALFGAASHQNDAVAAVTIVATLLTSVAPPSSLQHPPILCNGL